MKRIIALLFLFGVVSCTNQAPDKQTGASLDSTAVKQANLINDSVRVYTYEGSSGKVNETYLKTAPEHIKAILAYYCYQFNTGCADTSNCDLTRALGLGQDSPEHKALVLKWLNDEDTRLSIANGGNVKPNGGDSYAWLSNLDVLTTGNIIKIKYQSSWISKDIHGKGMGNDEYLLDGQQVKVLGRNHTELDVQ